MCSGNQEPVPSRSGHSASRRKLRSKQSKVQIYRLTRRRCMEEKEDKDEEMELKNIKLYLENQTIMEENKKLRQKANLLHQENLALMSEIQEKLSHSDCFSTALYLLLHKH